MIKFLGKRSLLKKSAPSSTPPPPAATATATNDASYDITPVASMYDDYDTARLGRPVMTDAEIEAVETGGASLFA
jgi:hypothetical protein